MLLKSPVDLSTVVALKSKCTTVSLFGWGSSLQIQNSNACVENRLEGLKLC